MLDVNISFDDFEEKKNVLIIKNFLTLLNLCFFQRAPIYSSFPGCSLFYLMFYGLGRRLKIGITFYEI